MRRNIFVLVVVMFLITSCAEDYDGGSGWPHTCPASCYCTATCTMRDGRTYTKTWQACACKACTNIFAGIIGGTRESDCQCSCGTNSVFDQVLEELYEPEAPLTGNKPGFYPPDDDEPSRDYRGGGPDTDAERQQELFQPLLDMLGQ